jgi:protein-L-isoaspartate(D-aspartate) O-methyltransferase
MSAAALVNQLAPDISDPRVLAAIAAVPRDVFVPAVLRDRAWENVPLPIGKGQTISQPLVVARMCEVLELEPTDRVLDVGTGSGYHAAVLAQLACSIVSIERHSSLSAQAAHNLATAGVDNVELVLGDGSLGYPARGPYDAINVGAASQQGVPVSLQEQLAPGGRLVVPVDGREQRLMLLRREGGAITHEALERVRFVPLVRESPGARWV